VSALDIGRFDALSGALKPEQQREVIRLDGRQPGRPKLMADERIPAGDQKPMALPR